MHTLFGVLNEEKVRWVTVVPQVLLFAIFLVFSNGLYIFLFLGVSWQKQLKIKNVIMVMSAFSYFKESSWATIVKALIPIPPENQSLIYMFVVWN